MAEPEGRGDSPKGRGKGRLLAKRRSEEAKAVKYLPESYIPGPDDVLLGRGAECVNHIGNQRFHQLVQGHVEQYGTMTKLEKTLLIDEIVQKVRQKSPKGGFIKRDGEAGRLYEVGDHMAREKTSQTFRNVSIDASYRSSNKAKQLRRTVAKHPPQVPQQYHASQSGEGRFPSFAQPTSGASHATLPSRRPQVPQQYGPGTALPGFIDSMSRTTFPQQPPHLATARLPTQGTLPGNYATRANSFQAEQAAAAFQQQHSDRMASLPMPPIGDAVSQLYFSANHPPRTFDSSGRPSDLAPSRSRPGVPSGTKGKISLAAVESPSGDSDDKSHLKEKSSDDTFDQMVEQVTDPRPPKKTSHKDPPDANRT